MQVTLDAIDYSQLTRHGSAEAFMEWYFEDGDDDSLGGLSCYDHEWSDSAILYNAVAETLEHLSKNADAELAEHLDRGIRRLVAENGHVDEFGTGDASEGYYWISASPETTREIKTHLDALDRARCVALLKKDPPRFVDEDMREKMLERGWLVDFIDQHARIVDLAVEKGFGLLGHIG